MLFIAAATYPMAMIVAFWRLEPRLLHGPRYPVLFYAIVPALLFAVALAFSASGHRIPWWAAVILLVLTAGMAAFAYFVWASMLWAV